MSYLVGSRAYLKRARYALQRRAPRHLFYAAFELRCCIEARQAEYAEALAALEGTKIRPWNIGATGKRIRSNSFASSITMMRYTFPDGTILATYHTPVSDALISFAERELNPLLHTQIQFRNNSDPWWKELREKLITGYRMSWLACRGDSLVPPLWDPKSRQIHRAKIEAGKGSAHLIELIGRYVGVPIQVEVAYPTTPPNDWICDL